MPFEFKTVRRVEFSETDMEGIMHYSNYFRFMETAEHGFMRSLGLSVVLSRSGLDVCLPRVHASCDYKAPLRFEDEVEIHLLVARVGQRSLTYQVRFNRVSPGPVEEVARGKLVVACAQRKPDGSIKATTLPSVLLEKLTEAPVELLGTPHHKASAQAASR